MVAPFFCGISLKRQPHAHTLGTEKNAHIWSCFVFGQVRRMHQEKKSGKGGKTFSTRVELGDKWLTKRIHKVRTPFYELIAHNVLVICVFYAHPKFNVNIQCSPMQSARYVTLLSCSALPKSALSRAQHFYFRFVFAFFVSASHVQDKQVIEPHAQNKRAT